MLLREEDTNKLARRSSIKDYEIIMLIGDNLGDFDSAFFGKTNQERWEASMYLKDNFGDKFILIPNLIYGDWEMGFK